MIQESNIVSINIASSEMQLIRLMAKAAERGGNSHVRSNGRMDMLSEDQLVGQIGTFAGHRYWFGSSYNYLISRQSANMNPMLGDGGSDILGANVDFKASRIRSNRPLLDYSLVVRSRERNPDKLYIQILVDMGVDTAVAYILGWSSDSGLGKPVSEGVFSGAYVVPARNLNPMPPIRWLWVETARMAADSSVGVRE